jgi:hypothetical protein
MEENLHLCNLDTNLQLELFKLFNVVLETIEIFDEVLVNTYEWRYSQPKDTHDEMFSSVRYGQGKKRNTDPRQTWEVLLQLGSFLFPCSLLLDLESGFAKW